MKPLRNRLSWIFCGAAFTVAASANLYLLLIHLPTWLQGNFIVGAFSGLLLISALAIATIFWGAGFFLQEVPLLNKLLIAVFVLSLIWFLIPSHFSMG